MFVLITKNSLFTVQFTHSSSTHINHGTKVTQLLGIEVFRKKLSLLLPPYVVSRTLDLGFVIIVGAFEYLPWKQCSYYNRNQPLQKRNR